MRAEVIAHGLDEVRREPAAAITIEIGERGTERRYRHAELRRCCDDMPPLRLRFLNYLAEIVIKQEVRQGRVPLKRLGDAVQEFRADDTPAAPAETDTPQFEVPVKFLACFPH